MGSFERKSGRVAVAEVAEEAEEGPRIRLLFVCLGNICRSPMAEAVVAGRLRDRGLAGIVAVDSAGTGGWHIGDRAHPKSRATGERHGTPITHRARQVGPDDLRRFDLMLAMDDQNLNDLRRGLCCNEAERARIVLFGSFDPEAVAAGETEIPDPYGGTDRDFEALYQRCVTAGDGLLGHVEGLLRSHSVAIA